MSRRKFRPRYVPPPVATSVSRPDLVPLAEELLERRTEQATDPTPLGGYALRQCAAELADHAQADAAVVITPAGWWGCGLVIVPTGSRPC